MKALLDIPDSQIKEVITVKDIPKRYLNTIFL
jgi:hypothetical protein